MYLLLFPLVLAGCSRTSSPFVVVYTSQDQVYAEPILRQFTLQTGIQVRAVYDSEAVKTVGLANRLRAERDHPQCDVFWSNEELRTRQLAAEAVFRMDNGWQPIGYRSRRVVINTNRLSVVQAPRSLLELTNVQWRGKVALAYPLFGTTATHFLALRQHWGEPAWLTWCRALQANRPFLVDGNSVVVKLVGNGEAWLGLTDSDDIAAGQRERQPLEALPLGPESWLIPNTVGLVRQAPHLTAAGRLYTWLQRPEVIQALIAARALEGPSPAVVRTRTLAIDWKALLRDLTPATRTLEGVYLR